MKVVGLRGLKAEGLDKHVTLLNEDWNEPEAWSVFTSYIEEQYGLKYVLTSTAMYYVGENGKVDRSAPFNTVVLGIYDLQNVLCAVHCFDPKDGSLGYTTTPTP